MMTASTSLRNSRIVEEDVNYRDNEPLLQNIHGADDIERSQRRNSILGLPPAHVSVVFVISMVCIFSFILSTVFFGVLYYKVSESAYLPEWPKASSSLLGDYPIAGVASDNEFCSEIGRDALLKGGNAIDAAIASLVCIGVLDVQSAGLGGGHLLTLYNATTKKCHVIDARETAPAKSFVEMFRNRYEKAQFGWEAVAVPGELHGMWTAYKNFGSGKLSWKSLLEPTIDLMKEGYPTSHALAAVLRELESNITSDPILKKSFINPETGRIYKAGEQITTRPNFIKTLEILANATDPVKEFYNGNLTKQMIREFKKNGGIIEEDDFRSYKSILRPDSDVIYANFANGIHACGPPPPSGAAVTLAILNLLDDFPMDSKTVDGNIQIFHRFLEASKFAYASRSELGDVDFVEDAMKIARNITSKEWAYKIRKLITEHAHPTNYYGGNFTSVPDHGTSHISVIDKQGNAVSVTSTINLYLGSQVMSDSTGIVWNDEMDDFSLPGHPNFFNIPPSPSNYIKPGKRPQSSMSPLIFYSNKAILSIGAAGGSQIISGVAYSSMHALMLGRNIKEAIDYPRLHNQLLPNYTEAETAFLPKYLTELEKRGQTFINSSRMTVVTGIMKFLKDGRVYANSDYRKGPESEPSGY